jgi:hypothetical protein
MADNSSVHNYYVSGHYLSSGFFLSKTQCFTYWILGKLRVTYSHIHLTKFMLHECQDCGVTTNFEDSS